MKAIPPEPDDECIRACLLELAANRAVGATFCPSEAARHLCPGAWRGLMPEIRRVAAALVVEGSLRCTQRGATAHPLQTRGAIRLSRPPEA